MKIISRQWRTGLKIAGLLAALGVASGCEGDKPAQAPTPGADKPAADKPAGEFVPGQQDAPKAVEVKADAFKGAGASLPNPANWDKYALTQDPEYFTKDTLFETIDGASDGYIAFGFAEMARGTYKPAQPTEGVDEINVEIYQFNDELGAFGKFGQERSACAAAEGVGVNWCLRQSDLLFWEGKNLVKVQTFDDSKAAEAAILEIARKVAEAIPGEAQAPKMLERFPAEGKVTGGGGYSPRDLFGFVGLKNAFTHAYQPAGDAYKDSPVTLFAAEVGEADAKALLDSIRKTAEGQKAVQDNGGIKAIEGVGDEAFMYQDSLGTHTFILKGGVVAGGREFKDAEVARALTTALHQSL